MQASQGAAAKAATSRLVAELAVAGSDDAGDGACPLPAWLTGSAGRTAAPQAPTGRQEEGAPAETETGAAGGDEGAAAAGAAEMSAHQEDEGAAKGKKQLGGRAVPRKQSGRGKSRKPAAAAAAQDGAGAVFSVCSRCHAPSRT